jgi:hypothetical protein
LLDDSISSSQSSPIPAAAGIGLRFPHHRQVLNTTPSVSWFEVHSENFFGGGTIRQTLLSVGCNYPLSLHGVELSLASAEGLEERHLQRLAELVQVVWNRVWSPEHLSWSVVDGRYFANLLPQLLPREDIDTPLADHPAAGRFIYFSGVSPT